VALNKPRRNENESKIILQSEKSAYVY